MKYKYIIFDTFNGSVKGTNGEEKAMEFSECEDYFVVNAQESEWICDGIGEEVEEI